MRNVFITGGTGYIGSRLIKALADGGQFRIKALVRRGSEDNLPPGCIPVTGDALDAQTYARAVEQGSVFIHLVGVAHPSPAKKEAFRTIDLASVQQAAIAATERGVTHFIYLSVSQFPSKIMHDYRLVRAEGEALLTNTTLPCSILRPWYVLGPGHWWPVLLLPFYGLMGMIPGARQQARMQGLVTIQQMIRSLVYAVNHPPVSGMKVYNVPDIKAIKK